MTLTSKAILRLNGRVDGAQRTAEFHFAGDLEITPERIPKYLLDGRAAIVNNYFKEQTGEQNTGSSVFIGDQSIQTVQIEFKGWEGSVDSAGNDLQWGDDPTSGGTKTSATSEGPLEQMAVLNYYLNNTVIDSGNPAELEYGEWSQSGRYRPMNVIIEGPQLSRASNDVQRFSGSIRFLKATDLNLAGDSAKRPG